MRGFLTALVLTVLSGVLFLNTGRTSLLTDGPITGPAMAEAGTGSAPHALAR